MRYCDAITYAGIKDIIEHCKELCYLSLYSMGSLTEVDMVDIDTLFDQLLNSGKQVDHHSPPHDEYYDFDHCFKITNKI
jgi:hypothetical protein